MSEKKTSFTFKLNTAQISSLTDILKHGNYRLVKVEHTSIAAEIPDCRINVYKSGKCLIQGREAEDFVTFIMEPMILEQAGLGYEEILNPEGYAPHMGVDESGKGDFFGPIVIASAFVNNDLANTLIKMGVRDSKTITSDKKMLALGSEVRKVLHNKFTVVKIGPEAYNRLYNKFRNLNNLLAWAHARAIENLLEKVPDCPRAISDQFGKKEQVEKALMKKGKNIVLEQMHKAESDIAVAAASILAREDFLRSLKTAGDKAGLQLPKGASAAVRAAAAALVRKHGPSALLDYTKCHFKTADEVLKETGFTRADVGEDAKAVSKPYTRPFKKKS